MTIGYVMIHNDVSVVGRMSDSNQLDHASASPVCVSLVYVLIPRPLKTLLTYRLTHHVEAVPQLGECVWVPLGTQEVIGCVWKRSDQTFSITDTRALGKTRAVILRLTWLPILSLSLRQLVEQIAKYYHVTLGEALNLALPSFSLQRGFLLTLPGDRPEQHLINAETESAEDQPHQLSLFSGAQQRNTNDSSVDQLDGTVEAGLPNSRGSSADLLQVNSMDKEVMSALRTLSVRGPLVYQKLPFYVSKAEWGQLIHQSILREIKAPQCQEHDVCVFKVKSERSWPEDRRERIERKVFEYLVELSREGQEYQATLETLAEAKLCASTSRLKRALRCLIEIQLITCHLDVRLPSRGDISSRASQEEDAHSVSLLSSAPVEIELTAEQTSAIQEVERTQGFQTFLLHGITGSGKTEVYLSLIEAVLARGGQALVLLPEIGLTPQTVRRFERRLDAPIYTWHSQLSSREKTDTWQSVGQPHPCVLIGARSALFSPLPELQIIIVDESHDGSYKQGDGVRYHARDMAIWRASLLGCPVILGSATPSLESMYNAQRGKYQLLQLTERPQGATLPQVRTVDLTTSRAISPGAQALTHTLATAIATRLNRGEQVILFLNRRGFSQSVRCTDCGFLFLCPYCAISLPWHHQTQRLQCHHCDFVSPLPTVCPQCNATQAFAPIGKGTERIEEQLYTLFPQAKIARLDRDSDLKSQALHELMQKGDIDILIGTQMVTKGHDFPRVTLVGVIDADVGLDLPDFRVNERSYQLLSQVAGRAGRAELKGEVIVQTYRPQDERLLAAITHDYGRFYLHELYLRQAIGYPPFGYLASIRLQAEITVDLGESLQRLQDALSDRGDVRVRGPSPAPLSQVQGQQRWIVLLISSDRQALHNLIDHIRERYGRSTKNVRFLIDIDPHDFT